MVKRELLARCMTCPLCRRILRDATTVSECLHTFCRKCIYKKLNDEELEHCPVCKIDLGCAPLEKLRADHNIQDMRSKIFPLKIKKVKAEEVESPIAPPAKRKERSISSLVVNTPEIAPKSLTGRRTRASTRKSAAALRDLGPIIPPVKKDSDNTNKNADNSSLLDSLSKVPQTRRQVLSNAETSSHPSSKDKGGDDKDLDKSELWRPLNCLVEAASKTKSFRSSPAARGNQPTESPSSVHASRTKAREYLLKSKVQDEKKEVPAATVPFKRKGPGRGRKPAQPPAAAVSSPAASKHEKLLTPVWFSLIASFDQKGAPPLPQIPTHYLRIKDDNMPASSIQKYIMQKLSLSSETETKKTSAIDKSKRPPARLRTPSTSPARVSISHDLSLFSLSLPMTLVFQSASPSARLPSASPDRPAHTSTAPSADRLPEVTQPTAASQASATALSFDFSQYLDDFNKSLANQPQSFIPDVVKENLRKISFRLNENMHFLVTHCDMQHLFLEIEHQLPDDLSDIIAPAVHLELRKARFFRATERLSQRRERASLAAMAEASKQQAEADKAQLDNLMIGPSNMQRELDALRQEEVDLIAKLESVRAKLADAEKKMADLPSLVKAQEAKLKASVNHWASLQHALKPIPGSEEDDRRIIEEVHEIRARAQAAIEKYLG